MRGSDGAENGWKTAYTYNVTYNVMNWANREGA